MPRELTTRMPMVTIWAYGYAAGTAPSLTHEIVGSPSLVQHWLRAYLAAQSGAGRLTPLGTAS